MASYKQWARAFDKPKKATWVCGSERVLVEEIVNVIRTAVGATDVDYVSMVAGSDKDKDIWSQMNQYPMEIGMPRLLLVRDAEKIKKWQPFVDWIVQARFMPTSYVLFVSGEHDFDTERPVHRAVVDKGGTMVRCSPLSEEDAIDWLQKFGVLHLDVGLYLLERAAGDLGRARQVMQKAALVSAEPISKSVVDVLASASAADEFSDALIASNRVAALRALEALDQSEYLRTIGLLDSRLETLSTIHRLAKRGQTPRDMAQQRTVNPFLARMLFPHAKSYDPATVDRRRSVLMLVDEYARSGARDGVMHALVSLW